LPVGDLLLSTINNRTGPGRYEWENSRSLEADARALQLIRPKNGLLPEGTPAKWQEGAWRMQRGWSVDEDCDSRRMEGLFRLGVDWLVTCQGSEAEWSEWFVPCTHNAK